MQRKNERSALRGRSWKRYFVLSDRYALVLTMASKGLFGVDSMALFDFDAPFAQAFVGKRLLLPGHRRLPAGGEQNACAVSGKGYEMTFQQSGKGCRLFGHAEGFAEGVPLLFDVTLSGAPMADGKPLLCSGKVSGMQAAGKALLGDREYLFAAAHSFGVLDVGRGALPGETVSRWACASGLAKGVPFGFSLWGMKDASGESLLFYAGKTERLACVELPLSFWDERGGSERPLRITGADGRFDMIFEPLPESLGKGKTGAADKNRRLILGRFTGSAVMQNGRRVEARHVMGFMEKTICKK